MTTTELIELLKKYEISGISKKPREISITINGELFIGEPTISVNGTGDGVAGAEINLDIDGDYEEIDDDETRFPYIEGELAEMFVDGEWIKGRIVDGYRFRDGVVTIETNDGKRYWCGQDKTALYRPFKEVDADVS